jgi:hypothetical protein
VRIAALLAALQADDPSLLVELILAIHPESEALYYIDALYGKPE